MGSSGGHGLVEALIEVGGRKINELSDPIGAEHVRQCHPIRKVSGGLNPTSLSCWAAELELGLALRERGNRLEPDDWLACKNRIEIPDGHEPAIAIGDVLQPTRHARRMQSPIEAVRR